MIDFDQPCFPSNIVTILAARFALIDEQLVVLRRPLRDADPNYSVGVFATDWTPTPDSYEMIGVDRSRAATLQQYGIGVQAFVKAYDEATGLTQHSVVSELLRTVLESDGSLRAALGGLTATVGSSTKVLQRWWVRGARYASGSPPAANGNNLYLITFDLTAEVEKL